MTGFARKAAVIAISVGIVAAGLWHFQLRWVLQDPATIRPDPDVERVISGLLEASRTAAYAERRAIFYQIRAMGRASLPMLVHALRNDSPKVRSLAAGLLQNSSNIHVTRHLESSLDDASPAVVRTALFSLAQLDAVEAIPSIIVTLNEGDKFTRCQAALVLGMLDDESAVQPLIACLEDDPYPLARKVAADSLGEIGGEQAVPSLIGSLEDKNARVRLASLRALNRITKAGLGPEKESWMTWYESELRRSAAE